MKFKIIHESVYSFSSEVFLEPHYLRFKPKVTPYHKIIDFNLEVYPTPSGYSDQTDGENNIIQLCWFKGVDTELSIKAESIIEVKEHLPFNFILYPNAFTLLPFTYSDSQKAILAPALKSEPISPELRAYAELIKVACNGQTVAFIANLTKQLHKDFTIVYRETGNPFDANHSFELKEVSCRDMAWMQIQVLRRMGMAARFVSGYFYIPLDKPDYELHAWVEVYLPGAGWVGMDPSNGIMTGQTHIPIATSAHYENTMPVTGTIRGAATSELKTKLRIEVIE